VDLSAGIGIAAWPEDAEDADTLLSRSEIAMYAAKRKLSGALRYDASIDSSSAQTLSLLTELRHAVEHNELKLYLQPKVPLHGQSGWAAEALVRWQHPQRGLVPPMQFIPFAEQTGFVRQLTLWMFEEVARFLAAAQLVGVLRVSVNLSTRDLLDPELSERLGAILQRYSVAASSFCLEITESAIMDDPQRAEAMLNRLSEQGFKLSIDDFGTGYSSLAYLKRLPVDELKIDKSFVMGMEAGEDDAMIVRSTIDLAHNLGLTVVAEGVENAAILERLRALACDEAQGYHISRPVPAQEFLAWQQRQG
jgi:EAL domain-containing protein (putative c-di-GMP-specific phosphodiesterase class I)